MKVITCKRIVGWEYVLGAATATQCKEFTGKEPSEGWKTKIAKSPHSPIRALQYFIQFTCPYFVSVHLVRHHEGVQWFVGSQRNDRQDKYDRRAARQDTEVMVTCIINAEELQFISRRRLCSQASPETRETWKMILDEIGKIDPIIASRCVPECVFRGFCPEIKSCGWTNSKLFAESLNKYRE